MTEETVRTAAENHSPLTIYLIRHGETAWSLSGQHTGSTDIPLTAHGEDEVRALAPALRGIPFVHVLTSPMRRAQQTCALSGLANGAAIEPDLSEWDYGTYEGQHTPDIHKSQPGWLVFRDGCPDGETPVQVSARADRLIAKLDHLSGPIALFTHGQFGCSFAARWIGLDIIEAQHLALNSAALSILGYNPSRPQTRVITLWNFTPRAVSARLDIKTGSLHH